MPLITILCPQTEAELALALAILEAHGIDTFVHGQYLGSLFPGLQIDSYNTRSIMVSEERANDALDALEELAPTTEPGDGAQVIRFRDKLRIVLEALLLGWFVPGGRTSK